MGVSEPLAGRPRATLSNCAGMPNFDKWAGVGPGPLAEGRPRANHPRHQHHAAAFVAKLGWVMPDHEARRWDRSAAGRREAAVVAMEAST
jgi:hypothetical protein